MRVTLFGTRGSIAAPGSDTIRYGGNTSTLEVRGADGTLLVIDAGTGIRRLGTQIPPTTRRIDILLTHLHMDHIQGLGFFAPLYNPAIEIHLWGPPGRTALDIRLSRYLSPPLFPVHLRDLPRVACHQVPDGPFDIGPFRVRASLICHPGPTLGVRLEAAEGTMCYLSDHEPALGMRNGRWPATEWVSGHELAAGADLLIHDAQYSDEEYEHCVGWGHSSYRHAFAFAALTGARQLVPFHHDPSHDDAMLDRLLADAVEAFKPRCSVSPGQEGAVFDIGRGPAAER